ncbi:aminoacyl-tRNA hydrolase [bacterium]|nr:aminoacyl-tRNA hydrolase [bacterium]
MRLIAGLGNPGKRYHNTWHNLGAMTVERLAARRGVALKAGKGDFFIAETTSSAGKTSLMIPTSFMNRSGAPISTWLRYYKVDVDEILVIYDDHDLPLGKIRIRKSGSSGGHRGMDDIIRMTGTDQIARLRIGIQTDLESRELSNQVLSKIPSALTEKVNEIINTALDAVDVIQKEGLDSAIIKYNKFEINDK